MSAHVRSLFGIKILNRKHQLLRQLYKTREEPSIYGDQVWQSSFLIMDYLERNPIPSHQNVMDIGCGWGLLGIFCAKQFSARVTLIDADCNVFPFATSHGLLNEVSVKTRQAMFSELMEKDFAQQDVVVGSDICFWPELAAELKILISRAMAAKVKQIILADPGRGTFLDLAKFCAKRYHCKLCPIKLEGKTRSKGYILVITNPNTSLIATQ